jgi:hypothetical protein
MKKIEYLIATFILCWVAVLVAANQTPGDNSAPAQNRIIPQEMKMYTLSVIAAETYSVDLGVDVKTASIVCDGADTEFNVSYDDGSTDSPGDLVTAGSDARVLLGFNGQTVNVLQNTEFNQVYAKTGSGSATCYIYPGGGLSQ